MQTIRTETPVSQNPDQLAFPIEAPKKAGGEVILVDFIGKTRKHPKEYDVDVLASQAREAATTQLISLLPHEPSHFSNEPAAVVTPAVASPDFAARQPELTGWSKIVSPLVGARGEAGPFLAKLHQRAAAKRSAALPKIIA